MRTTESRIRHRRAPRTRGALLAAAVVALAAATPWVPAVHAAALRAAAPAVHVVSAHRVCSTARPGAARCHALDATPQGGIVPTLGPLTGGLTPAQLQLAYQLPAGSAGAGQSVAIVDAYDDPNAESDLTIYRAEFGLPPCLSATGCLRKLDQRGGTTYPAANNSAWATEISLDLDMVSAICPLCHIVLVEADDNTLANLAAAEDEAASQSPAAISNSYGETEDAGETAYETDYHHPGIAITASSGDSGYGVQYPAASQYVTAVGGTRLSVGASPRGWVETAWSGAGSGCSAYIAKPSWQKDTGCANRTVADVSAVADPASGVDAYDTYGSIGWRIIGGTSVAAPIIAAVYALAGAPSAAPGAPYDAPAQLLWDVTSGSNGACTPSYLCTAGPGYDGPTGLGTPVGAGAFGLVGA